MAQFGGWLFSLFGSFADARMVQDENENENENQEPEDPS